MRVITFENYAPAARGLFERARRESRPSSLVFGSPVQDVRDELLALNNEKCFSPRPLRSGSSVQCLHSALWMLFDYFQESHTLAQSIHTPSGSYLHAIQHRREPDASNSKHWFSRVGEHPVFAELIKDAKTLAGKTPPKELEELVQSSAWDPDVMVKLCTTSPGPSLTPILLAIQRRELELLYAYEFKAAFA